MRLIFMGTPDFAVPTLLALAAAGHDIAAVYTRAPSDMVMKRFKKAAKKTDGATPLADDKEPSHHIG